MARGYEGQFGHKLNAPWVWIPLCVALPPRPAGRLAPPAADRPPRPARPARLRRLALLLQPRRDRRSRSRSSIRSSPTCWLRMLWIGFRGGRAAAPERPSPGWLIAAAVFLIAFRIDPQRRRLGSDRRRLLGRRSAPTGSPTARRSTARGSSPTTTASATPTARRTTTPTSRSSSPCRGAASGTSCRPRTPRRSPSTSPPCSASSPSACARAAAARAGASAAILAFGWLAYPYTAFALQSNSNDSLVAALLVWRLALFARPLARGALLALAAMAKFAPLILAPLFAAGERGLRPVRRCARRSHSALAFAAVCALMLAHPAIDPGLATFWERTVESQLDRSSPFSVWGQVDRDPVAADARPRGGPRRSRSPSPSSRPGARLGRRSRRSPPRS